MRGHDDSLFLLLAHLDPHAPLERLHDGGEILVGSDLVAGAPQLAHDRFRHLHRDAERPGLRERQPDILRSEEHTSELQSRLHLVCRLLLEKKKKKQKKITKDNNNTSYTKEKQT